MASETQAMVLAVNWPPQAPSEGHAALSRTRRSSSARLPEACWPTASKTSWMVTSRPWKRPGKMAPPYMKTAGTLSRSIAIIIPGRDLSQPASTTIAS